MKLKRGTVREDGMIFWQYMASCINGERWLTEEEFNKLQFRVKKKNKEKSIKLKNKKREFKRGHVRQDKMVFWGYSPTCKNNERWITEEAFNNLILKEKERYYINLKEHKKRKKIFKMGDVRDDGMVFWQYMPNSKNGEIWLSKENFVRNKKAANARRRINSKTCKAKKNRNEYEKKRKENDIVFRLSSSIRTLICVCIKNKNFKKDTKTTQILGCTIPEFKKHIESQFLSGMSWENRNLWHLDHIMPVSMAKTYDEVVRLNHYKNLRPMWASDNLRKSDKIGDALVLF